MTGYKAIPAWLQRHLENTGRWNADGIGRAARARTCRCGATVLRGLDDDRCALPRTVDPGPLDPAGELTALATGRATFRLINVAGKWELDRRTQYDIAAQPAGTVNVLAEHKCGQPILANGLPIRNPQPKRITVEEQTCPPF